MNKRIKIGAIILGIALITVLYGVFVGGAKIIVPAIFVALIGLQTIVGWT